MLRATVCVEGGGLVFQLPEKEFGDQAFWKEEIEKKITITNFHNSCDPLE